MFIDRGPINIHFLLRTDLLPTAFVAKIRKSFQEFPSITAFSHLGASNKMSRSRDEKQFLKDPYKDVRCRRPPVITGIHEKEAVFNQR